MNDSFKNSLFKNPKTRVFLVLALVIVAVLVIIFAVHLYKQAQENAASASVAGGPGLASIPGAGNPSDAYVAAQNKANLQGEEAARKSATAFVPTITRAGFVGNEDQFGQVTSPLTNEGNAPQHCVINKVVLAYKPNPENCTSAKLIAARNSGVTAEELMCQGCACPELKAAGYNAAELKNIGLNAAQLKECGFDLQSLVSAGFSADALKDAGFSATALKAAGFSAGELKAAGFSAADLKSAGFSAAQLKKAGFSAADLAKAGFSKAAIAQAGFAAASAPSSATACSATELAKERTAGVSATVLHDKGCGLAALKAAGYSARALRAAGFSAAELKDAGFDAKDLRAAGFSASQLKEAGFNAAELKDAGFSAGELKAAGFTAGQLAAAGFSARDLKDAGFSAAQLHAAGFSAEALKNAGFSASELADAGYTKGDLARAGFSEPTTQPVTPTATAQSPEIIPGNTEEDALAATSGAASQTEVPSINASAGEARLAKLEKQQDAEMSAQQQANQQREMMGLMMSQADKFMSGWSNLSEQEYVEAAEVVKPNSLAGSAVSGLASMGSQTLSAVNPGAATSATQTNALPPLYKAGSVLFGVLDTSVNSDEKTPIMARIVSGKLKGSKLLGSFTREGDNVFIQFTLLSDPDYPNSIPINAVAIDPNTARTALSGQVNHHYMLRYGSLFASSFLQGVAEGVINTGVASTCLYGSVGCTINMSSLSPTKQVEVGLGKVGQAYSQHMSGNFNLPPTVRIAAGTGFGLLLMGDLDMPTDASSQNANTQLQAVSQTLKGLAAQQSSA